MTREEELLLHRFIELSKRAEIRGVYAYTGFLSMAEIALFQAARARIGPVPHSLWGGMEGCERQMLRFGSLELCGYAEEFPIKCLAVTPLSQRFADALTHRDFLGALMNLGVERSTLGDIVVKENRGYLFCTDAIAPFVTQQLTRVKRTSVSCALAREMPAGALFETEAETVSVSSERADGVTARVYGLSREESLALFRAGRVFLNGGLLENNSAPLREGDLISVRGYGRFLYRGLVRTSKKGKLQVLVERYRG